MRKKSLVATTCVLLLALTVVAPVWATGPSASDDTGVPRIGFVSEVVGWFLGVLLAAPHEDGPKALQAARSGTSGSGTTTTDGGSTTDCGICLDAESRYAIDPDG